MRHSPKIEQHGNLQNVTIDRRRLLQGASATAIAGKVAAGSTTASAQEATPASSVLSSDDLLRISQGLVGGGSLNAEALPRLTGLIGDDPALSELAGLTSFSAETIESFSPAAHQLATNVVRFWYLGEWDGQPIADRSDLYFSLVEWQAVPYATQPTLCKEFGYWATEIDV